MTQLTIHRAVTIEQTRETFEASERCHKFFRLEIIVTDESGIETTITILSNEYLSFPAPAPDLAGELFKLGVSLNRATVEELSNE